MPPKQCDKARCKELHKNARSPPAKGLIVDERHSEKDEESDLSPLVKCIVMLSCTNLNHGISILEPTGKPDTSSVWRKTISFLLSTNRVFALEILLKNEKLNQRLVESQAK